MSGYPLHNCGTIGARPACDDQYDLFGYSVDTLESIDKDGQVFPGFIRTHKEQKTIRQPEFGLKGSFPKTVPVGIACPFLSHDGSL